MTEFGGQKTEDGGLKVKNSSVFSIIFSILCPLLVLLAAIFLASMTAYFAVLIFGDDVSFRTVFKKSIKFFLVFSVFPLAYWLKLSKTDLGVSIFPIFIKQLFRGFGLGIVTLLPVVVILFWLGVNIIDETKPWTASWLGKKLIIEYLLAILISIAEEPLFRGILLTGLSKKMPVAWAIVVSSFYYAAPHFVNSNIEISAQDAGLFSGFILLDDAISQLFSQNFLSPFLALFTVGVFLGVLRTQVKSSLALCIGCHAAWVWLIKLNKSLFNTDLKSEYLYLVSGYDGVIGPLVTIWLALAIAGYLVYQHKIS